MPDGYSRSIQPICANQKPRRMEYGSRSYIIDVQMVGAMPAGPDEHAVLQRHRAEDEIYEPKAQCAS